jgi:dienelactone hydrolase
MVTVKSFDGGEFDAYMALPAGGYGPGIVVLQEIFGTSTCAASVVGTRLTDSSRFVPTCFGARNRVFS